MISKLNAVENVSLQDGDLLVGGGGGARCALTPGGCRRLERASSMPGRVPCPSYLAALTMQSRPSPVPRLPPPATTPFQPGVLSPPRKRQSVPEKTELPGGVVGSSVLKDVEVTVSPASTSGSAGRVSTGSSTTRRQQQGPLTSGTVRRKRVVGVSVDENNVPLIDRAVSPPPPAPASPTVTVRDTLVSQPMSGRDHRRQQPIYTRRFASLRLPSGARATPGYTAASSRYQAPSTLLSPVSAVNGSSSVHRSMSGSSYTRMQLLHNIGNTHTRSRRHLNEYRSHHSLNYNVRV